MSARVVTLPLVLLCTLTFTLPAAAQSGGSSSRDIRQLDDLVMQIGADIEALEDRDTALARNLRGELDDLRDEVTYLRVKARRDTVSRAEITDLRERLEALQRRAKGDTARRPARVGGGAASRQPGEIPVGQELDVRLQSPLDTETAQVEDRFEATTIVDLMEGERVLVPAGSTLRGVVRSVQRAGRFERRASITLSFDQLRVRGVEYPIRATVIQALETGGYREDAGKIGAGAAVGAVIGGILGGFRGAMAGVLIGGGGTIAATEGKELELPVGTVLRVRFDEPTVLEAR